jgi:hypothetical protein
MISLYFIRPPVDDESPRVAATIAVFGTSRRALQNGFDERQVNSRTERQKETHFSDYEASAREGKRIV